MSEHSPGPWRVGRKVGRTIYNADDRLIGVMDTVVDAAAVVLAVNHHAALLDMLRDGLGWEGLEPRWRRDAEALILRIEGT